MSAAGRIGLVLLGSPGLSIHEVRLMRCYLNLRLLLVDLVLQVFVLFLAAGELDLNVSETLLQLVDLSLCDLD